MQRKLDNSAKHTRMVAEACRVVVGATCRRQTALAEKMKSLA